MKRLYAFIPTILFCTLAFSQHPYSRGDNPLYWALVGGISTAMFYVFYLLFGLFVNLIKRLKQRKLNISEKIHLPFSKDNEKITSGNEICCDLQVERERLDENIGEENHQDTTLCKQCGKQISANALYCSYCGASQSRTPSTLRKLSHKFKDLSYLNAIIKKFVRFIIVLALLALLGWTIAFIFHEIWGINDSDAIICAFAPIAAYALYCLLYYAYKFKHKRKILIIAILVLLVLSLWGISIADSINREASRRVEEQREEELHRVNRTFLGCSFGDNASKVSNTLRKYVPNHLLPPTQFRGRKIDKIWLENIQYGDYTLNSISFIFFRDKLYKVVMDFQTYENESYSDLWTYKHLSTMLGKKYEKDLSAEQYDNIESYCDNHTAVKIWHSTYEMGKYEVNLTYYDKDSGYKEHQEEGF